MFLVHVNVHLDSKVLDVKTNYVQFNVKTTVHVISIQVLVNVHLDLMVLLVKLKNVLYVKMMEPVILKHQIVSVQRESVVLYVK